MTQLSRRIAAIELARLSALALGATVAIVLAAYIVAAATATPTPGPLAAAVALLAVTGSGLLYAWRLGTGGLGD